MGLDMCIYRESLPGIYGYRWRFGEEENDIDYAVRDPRDKAGGATKT